MASLKNPTSIFLQFSWYSRTHIFSFSLLLLSLILLSASFTDQYSPALLASTFAARIVYAASYFSPLSSISSTSTCLVSESETNCSLPSVTAVERTHRNPRGSNPTQEFSSCDIFNGSWVLEDDSCPLYPVGSCPFVDDAFNCFKNGRPDFEYLRYRWKPFGCEIPMFDGRKMLEILRGKRMVFVGDSLNRNMWESLVCALRESLKDKRKIFEVSGRREFRTQGFYSFIFKDYNCSIDFIKSPFLVQEWKLPDKNGKPRRERLRLDMIQGSSSTYADADIIIFNTGHWWTHQKTYKGKDYFQEGRHVYRALEVTEAYTKALKTWAHWVDSTIDSRRTRVFFRGYSASHFRKRNWNTGGQCHGEKQPLMNETELAGYPWMMNILESVIAEMKTPVFYLNITRMTNFRKDGHPSVFRPMEIQRAAVMAAGMVQDCSHWCLPGVPDSWNELLYATLLLSGHDSPGGSNY
ncbi:hypothetical protein SLE2022_253360 [Rubroshorea leprosula]